MSIVSEFKAFAMRGNVVDMAVGIVIGTAFGRVVSSFVADVLMPPIGMLLGNVDFTSLAFTLSAATDESEAIMLRYGSFLQIVINFVIIAVAAFLVIKAMNTVLKKKEAEPPPAPPPAPSREEELLTEIRDALRNH